MADVDLQIKIESFLDSAYKKFIVRDYDSAIRELKAAEVLDKNNPEILYNLGVNYCRLGLFKTAVGYFTKMLKLQYVFIDALTVKKLLAYALIRLEDYKEAEGYIKEVLQFTPADVTTLSLKGYCLEMQGHHAKAVQAYQAIIEIEDKNYTAYNSISYITAKTGGDLNRSLQFARIAHDSNPENPAYLDTLGYVHLKMGNLAMAEKFLTAALEKLPLSREIQGHIQELKKNRDRAR